MASTLSKAYDTEICCSRPSHSSNIHQAKCAAALLAEVELLTQQLDEEAGSRLAAEEQAEAANMHIEGLEQQLQKARVRQPAV